MKFSSSLTLEMTNAWDPSPPVSHLVLAPAILLLLSSAGIVIHNQIRPLLSPSPDHCRDRLSLETHHHPSQASLSPLTLTPHISPLPPSFFSSLCCINGAQTYKYSCLHDTMQSGPWCYCFWTQDLLSKTSFRCQFVGECCNKVLRGIGFLFDNKGAPGTIFTPIVSSWWHAAKYFSLLSSPCSFPESFRKEERDRDRREAGTNTRGRTQTPIPGERGDVLLVLPAAGVNSIMS